MIAARPAARAAVEAWLAEHGTLEAAAAATAGAETRRGRGTVHVVPAPGGEGGKGGERGEGGEGGAERWAVRHYHRGGSVARLLGDRYLRLGRPRPLREFDVTVALETMGVPAPRAVAASVYPRGLFYTGDIITEFVPGSADLVDLLFADAGPGDARGADPGPRGHTGPALMAAAGRLVRVLHDRGVRHPDLNVKNVLIRTGAAGPEALVLDLDRARIGRPVGRRGRRRMIERFWRSVRKWEAKAGRRLGPEHRQAFEDGYGAEPAR